MGGAIKTVQTDRTQVQLLGIGLTAILLLVSMNWDSIGSHKGGAKGIPELAELHPELMLENAQKFREFASIMREEAVVHGKEAQEYIVLRKRHMDMIADLMQRLEEKGEEYVRTMEHAAGMSRQESMAKLARIKAGEPARKAKMLQDYYSLFQQMTAESHNAEHALQKAAAAKFARQTAKEIAWHHEDIALGNETQVSGLASTCI
jgi:hypothetical protein